jgi:DNA-binding transcriptional ArsR family regulator
MANSQATLDERFHALADPTRRAVVRALARGPARVSDLAAPFPMALPTFLRHLRVLEDAGLVATRKAGRTRTCRLRPRALAPVEGWAATTRAVWERRFDRLGAALDGMDEGPRDGPDHGPDDTAAPGPPRPDHHHDEPEDV